MRQKPTFSTQPRPPLRNRCRRAGERGAVSLKAVVWLLFFLVSLYVGIKVVPVLFSGYEFEDSMKTTARFASVNRQSPDDIRKNLLTEAQKDDLPLKPEDIKVTQVNGDVQIDASYSVTVDLQFYQWTLNFHPTATNNAL